MTTKFRLLTEVDTPTVVGKAWWNEALKLTQGGDARRAAMVVIGAGAAFMVLPPLLSSILGDSDDGPGTNTVTSGRSSMPYIRMRSIANSRLMGASG